MKKKQKQKECGVSVFYDAVNTYDDDEKHHKAHN